MVTRTFISGFNFFVSGFDDNPFLPRVKCSFSSTCAIDDVRINELLPSFFFRFFSAAFFAMYSLSALYSYGLTDEKATGLYFFRVNDTHSCFYFVKCGFARRLDINEGGQSGIRKK